MAGIRCCEVTPQGLGGATKQCSVAALLTLFCAVSRGTREGRGLLMGLVKRSAARQMGSVVTVVLPSLTPPETSHAGLRCKRATRTVQYPQKGKTNADNEKERSKCFKHERRTRSCGDASHAHLQATTPACLRAHFRDAREPMAGGSRAKR
jgi:hypothetical protein